MLLKKNRYVRIKVIGGSGIFDSIMNIIKKPIVSKLLTPAGKSIASKLGEKLVSKVLPANKDTSAWRRPTNEVSSHVNNPGTPATVMLSSQAQDIIAKYGSSVHNTDKPVSASKDSVISIEDYVKRVRGGGIKVV